MEALQKFCVQNSEIVTFGVVVAACVGYFIVTVAISNSVAKAKEGQGFRRSLASQYLGLAIGAIAMYLWYKYM